VVEVKDNPAHALRIFRTLNARGRDISQMDTVKVDFLQRVADCKGGDHDLIGDGWETYIAHLGEEQFQEMFKLIHIHRTGYTSAVKASSLEKAFEGVNPIIFFDAFVTPTFNIMNGLNNNHLGLMSMGDEDLTDEEISDSEDGEMEDETNKQISITLDYLKLLPNDDWKLVAVYVLASFKHSSNYFNIRDRKPITREKILQILQALLNRYTWNWIKLKKSSESDIKPRNKLKREMVRHCKEGDWDKLITAMSDDIDKASVIAAISGTGRTDEKEYGTLNRFLLLRVNEMRQVAAKRTRLNLHESFAKSLVNMPVTSKDWSDAHETDRKSRVDINRLGALTLQTNTRRGEISELNQVKAQKLFKKESKKLAISKDLRELLRDGKDVTSEAIMRRHMGICEDIAKAFDLPQPKWDKNWTDKRK
jgi:hypothetical protein